MIPKYAEGIEIPGQMNILIAGKNGALMDVIMIANINPEKRRVTLVSVPRDLYYNNRKINSYYALYGMEEVKRILAKITGYQIDKFILVDMYAFIDVIDLIGGVDVHLDQAVIDPTYKVNDNGVWSTLYYRAGDYHFSGKEALRVARTRHTTSDFARAERQQMIIKAVQAKARKFGFGDAGKLTEMAKAILNRTETDFALTDAIPAYFRYQGFEIKSGNVVSDGNVLQSSYTGEAKVQKCLQNISKNNDLPGEDQAKSEEQCRQENKGQYILQPAGGDWNVIRWYFHQIFEQ